MIGVSAYTVKKYMEIYSTWSIGLVLTIYPMVINYEKFYVIVIDRWPNENQKLWLMKQE